MEYEKMKGKTFTIVRAEEKLCEVCDKPLRTIQISDHNNYSN